jgi:small basic protein
LPLGLKTWAQRQFRNKVFLYGLLVNCLVAGGPDLLRRQLGVELYFAAIVAFGVTIFDNIAVIRRQLL